MENHIRLFLLIKEVTTFVLQLFLENKYIKRNCTDLKNFLQQERHNFFHLTFPKHGQCCCCSLGPSFGSRQAISKHQFEKFFDNSNNFTCGTSARTHSCQFTVKTGIDLKHIDITCGLAILFNVFGTNITQQEEICLKDIRAVRNDVAHHSTEDIPEGEYNTLKGKILNATIYIAKILGNQCDKDVQEKIERILQRRVLVGSEDYTEYLHYLLELRQDNSEFHDFGRLIEVILTKIDNLDVKVDRLTTAAHVATPPDTRCQSTSMHVMTSDFKNEPTALSVMTSDFRDRPPAMPVMTSPDFRDHPTAMPVMTSPDFRDHPTAMPVMTSPDFRDQPTTMPMMTSPDIRDQPTAMTVVTPSDMTNQQNDSSSLTVQQLCDEETLYLTDDITLTKDINQTAIKAIEPNSVETCQNEYLDLYNNIVKLKVEGKTNPEIGEMFALLIYIAISGYTTLDADLEKIRNIYKTLYDHPMRDNADISKSFGALMPEYIEEIDCHFTVSNSNVLKSVVNFYATLSVQNLIEICTCHIILEYILPDSITSDEFFLTIHPVSADMLVSNLIQRLAQKGQAFLVGKYITKVYSMPKGNQFLDLFIDTFEQNEINVNSYQLTTFLDGLTSSGKNFKLFEQEKLYNVFTRQVDKYGNTIFHYMAVLYNRSDRYEKYIIYISEKKNFLLLIPNDDGLTALDIAAYLGRYGIIYSVISSDNIENWENVFVSVSQNFKEGVDLLLRLNSEEQNLTSKFSTDLKQATLGESKDYISILDFLGAKAGLFNDESNDEKENKKENKTEEKKKDAAQVLGENILGVVKDIKKGLNALTQLPKLVKEIHQSTNLGEDSDKK